MATLPMQQLCWTMGLAKRPSVSRRRTSLVAARMEQAARIETLTWLAASGLLSQASDPATRTEVFNRVPAGSPGLEGGSLVGASLLGLAFR